jgi:hypothetical protein
MSEMIRAPRLLRNRRIASVERLEHREMLSADAGLGQLASAGHAAAAFIGDPNAGVQHFEISIIGTEVSYSPAGLPSDMKGTVYLQTPAGASTAAIGTYDEMLTPIFAPVGPGGSLTFVGASGTCTFTFDLLFGPANAAFSVGSIVTNDTAYISGMQSDGTLLVTSTSSPITASNGICAGLSGTFDGQSEVKMGATFYMHTLVDFAVVNRSHVNMQETLTELAEFNAAASQGFRGQPDNQLHSDDGHDARHAGLPHSEWLAHRNAAVDSIFAGQVGPLAEGVLPRRFS